MAQYSCPGCEQVVESGVEVCPNCGADITAAMTVAAETRSQPADEGPAVLQFAPGFVFADRFTIVQKAGAGGMGVVYKALDRALDQDVALKLIRPDRANHPMFTERFRREVRLTRQITHPNVCRVHDIGEWNGIMYLSMEWIEGETLQRLMRQVGRLDRARALEIAEKTALALEAAHEKGIVHRDLKPANVMIDEQGQIRVLDFGLAFEQQAPDSSGSGILVGSPPYMAPEQRRLEPIDHRVDLYALGLILREMLAGPRSEDGPQLTAAVRAAAGPEITPLLERLLAARAEDRPPTAGAVLAEVRAALERLGALRPRPTRKRRGALAAGVAALIVVVAAGVLWLSLRPAPSPIRDPQARAYYERAMYYLEEGADTVGATDDVLHLLHRAAAIEPDNALICAGLAQSYWRRYEFKRDPSSREEAERAAARTAQLDPSSLEASVARAIGLHAIGDNRAAKEAFEQVLRVRPDYTTAWTRLATVREALQDFAGAREAHEKAVASNPGNFRALLYKAIFHQRQGEWSEALACFRKATEVKPDSSLAWSNLGGVLLHTQRFAEAIPALERAIQIDDRASARSNLGTAFYFQNRYEDAVEQYRRAAELEPARAAHWGNLGDVLLVLGKPGEAKEAYRTAADAAREAADQDSTTVVARLDEALYCAKAGDSARALEAAAAAFHASPHDPQVLFVNAVVRRLAGRDDESLEWLERAVKFGASKAQIYAEPAFEGLKDDPRFKKIVQLAS